MSIDEYEKIEVDSFFKGEKDLHYRGKFKNSKDQYFEFNENDVFINPNLHNIIQNKTKDWKGVAVIEAKTAKTNDGKWLVEVDYNFNSFGIGHPLSVSNSKRYDNEDDGIKAELIKTIERLDTQIGNMNSKDIVYFNELKKYMIPNKITHFKNKKGGFL